MKNLGQSKSVVSDFMKKKKQEDGSSFEEGMLKLLRTLPKVLKFLPSDKAADARTFMMSFQYWLGGELVLFLLYDVYCMSIERLYLTQNKLQSPHLLPHNKPTKQQDPPRTWNPSS